MKALLIIDMQVDSFRPETPRYNAKAVIDRINSLSDKFREENNPVIFVQHRGQDDFIPGSDGWKILPDLVYLPSDIIIAKTANDAFYKTDLLTELKKNDVDELFITGCATDFCVDTTVRSALANDFNVVVVMDCHTTADRTHLPAKKVIEHHNWLWENMIPTKGKIRLVNCKDIIS